MYSMTSNLNSAFYKIGKAMADKRTAKPSENNQIVIKRQFLTTIPRG